MKVTIEEQYAAIMIEAFVHYQDLGDDRKILYDGDYITVIQWLTASPRVSVYIPKGKEKDLSRLPDKIRDIILKEEI